MTGRWALGGRWALRGQVGTTGRESQKFPSDSCFSSVLDPPFFQSSARSPAFSMFACSRTLMVTCPPPMFTYSRPLRTVYWNCLRPVAAVASTLGMTLPEVTTAAAKWDQEHSSLLGLGEGGMRSLFKKSVRDEEGTGADRADGGQGWTLREGDPLFLGCLSQAILGLGWVMASG